MVNSRFLWPALLTAIGALLVSGIGVTNHAMATLAIPAGVRIDNWEVMIWRLTINLIVTGLAACVVWMWWTNRWTGLAKSALVLFAILAGRTAYELFQRSDESPAWLAAAASAWILWLAVLIWKLAPSISRKP